MTAKEHLSLHDRQIAATRALIHEGMRLVIETSKDLRIMANMQKKTDASLKALIDSLRGGNGQTNGRTKPKR